MKKVHMQLKIDCFLLIWLMACKNGLACLTFYFSVVRGEGKASASVRNSHDMGEKTQKSFKYLWIRDPREFGKGIVQQQSQAPSLPKPTLHAAHQPAPLALRWRLIRSPKSLFALAHVHLCLRQMFSGC